MSDEANRGAPRRGKPNLIDVTVPNAARVADYLGGGRDNFTVDREAGRVAAAILPAIERMPGEVREFRRRVITYLVESGVRQFLQIGITIAPSDGIHEVAQAFDPHCRVLYTAQDPMTLSRAQAELRSAPGGAVDCVEGDIRDVDAILASAPPTLDLSQPVAVMVSTLWHVPTAIAAGRAVSSLLAPMPPGSYIAIYHLASDLDPDMAAVVRQWNKSVPVPATLRARLDVLDLVAGLDLVDPGVVPVNHWRPGPDVTPEAVPVHGLVARKR